MGYLDGYFIENNRSECTNCDHRQAESDVFLLFLMEASADGGSASAKLEAGRLRTRETQNQGILIRGPGSLQGGKPEEF